MIVLLKLVLSTFTEGLSFTTLKDGLEPKKNQKKN